MKVSVVVPVYNTGRHIQAMIDSLLGQSMAPSEYEGIFVDDGSTDETPATLDRLAAEHANMRVIHQPNSGWPGKPRNVGIAAANGDYVFFADHDDWLGPEALERMYAAAQRTGADVVIGKMAGHGRGVPRELFRRNLDHATLDNAPLVDSLTPHKLFRRAFLNEHQLRFPEGKRRLEDHVFVMAAYFLANHVSVVADYDCYHHIRRDDEANAGFSDIDPVSYYGYVRETLDVIAAHTEPGKLRDRLLRRFLRVELLSRLESRPFADGDSYSRTLWREVRTLLLERFPPSVEAGLPVRQRLLCSLLRDDRWQDALAAVRWSRSASATVPGSVRVLATPGEARLALESVVATSRSPLVEERNSAPWLSPPLAIPPDLDLDVSGELRRAAADVVFRLGGGEDRLARAQSRFEASGGSVHVTFDAATPALSNGTWRVFMRLRLLGLHFEQPVQRRRFVLHPTPAGPAVFVEGRLARPFWDIDRRLAVDVGGSDPRLQRLSRVDPRRARVSAEDGDWLVRFALPVCPPADQPLPLLVRTSTGAVEPASATAVVTDGGCEVTLQMSSQSEGGELLLDAGESRIPLGVAVVTSPDGVRVQPVRYRHTAWHSHPAGVLVRRLVAGARRRGRRTVRRVSAAARRG